MDLTNCETVAAPNEWPANAILPGVWTSILPLKMERGSEVVFKFKISFPSSMSRSD